MSARGISQLRAFPPSRTFRRYGVKTRALRPQSYAMAFCVIAAAPSPVSWRSLADLLWGDDPDGGPLDATNHMHVLANYANADLAPINVRLTGMIGGVVLRGLAAVDLYSQSHQNQPRQHANADGLEVLVSARLHSSAPPLQFTQFAGSAERWVRAKETDFLRLRTTTR